MDQDGLVLVAVIIGATMIGAVVWNYLRHLAQQNMALSVSLTLIGFALVSSPHWGSIVVKGPQFEIAMLRKQVADQADAYVELAELYQKRLPPNQAAEVAPAVNELRASVRSLKLTTDPKKISEVSGMTGKFSLAVRKVHP